MLLVCLLAVDGVAVDAEVGTANVAVSVLVVAGTVVVVLDIAFCCYSLNSDWSLCSLVERLVLLVEVALSTGGSWYSS
jgi:hypothetical protein